MALYQLIYYCCCSHKNKVLSDAADTAVHCAVFDNIHVVCGTNGSDVKIWDFHPIKMRSSSEEDLEDTIL